MGRPRIGVTGSGRGGRTMWLFNRLAVWRAGATAVRITAGRPFPLEELDGVVIGGGDDIDAKLYGGGVEPTVRIDPERDRLELRVLDWAERLGMPVLGICRGSQMINVHRGGSLHADIHTAYLDAPRMRTPLPRKLVEIEPGSRLGAVLGLERCRVNALHHQSVDRLGHGLRRVARDGAGIVQGIEAPDARFLLGVQWHPEFLALDRHQQNLFRALAAAARLRAAGEDRDAGARREPRSAAARP
jgi:putative glutamine amidotransferase